MQKNYRDWAKISQKVTITTALLTPRLTFVNSYGYFNATLFVKIIFQIGMKPQISFAGKSYVSGRFRKFHEVYVRHDHDFICQQ